MNTQKTFLFLTMIVNISLLALLFFNDIVLLTHFLLLGIMICHRQLRKLMAPSRKSRSVNKRFSYINEVASSKDGENANKRQRVSPGFVQKVIVF